MKMVILITVIFLLVITLNSCTSPQQENGFGIHQNQCEGKKDGEFCSIGLWYDQFGRTCAGKSCVGLSLGKCVNNECLRIDDYYSTLFGNVTDNERKIDICFEHGSAEFLIYCLNVNECQPEGYHCLYQVLNAYGNDKIQLTALCGEIGKKMSVIAQEYGKPIPRDWELENCKERFSTKK